MGSSSVGEARAHPGGGTEGYHRGLGTGRAARGSLACGGGSLPSGARAAAVCVCVCVCARAHPTPVCPGGPAPAWTLPPVGSALTRCLGLPVPRPLGGGSSVCVSCFPLSEGSHACNLGPPPHPVPSSGHLPRATSRGPASQAGFSVFIFKQPLLRVPAHGTSWGSLQHWGCGTGMMMLTMFP